jgi:signal transduction histidine kinase
MNKILSLLEELRNNPQGRYMRFLLFGSYSTVLLVMAITMGITLKFGSDVAELGADILGKRFPQSIELLKLKQEINQANSQMNSYLINKDETIKHLFFDTQKSIVEKADNLYAQAENNDKDNIFPNARIIKQQTHDILILSKQLFDFYEHGKSWDKKTQVINILFAATNNALSEIISIQLKSSQADGAKLNNKLSHIVQFNIGIMAIALIFGLFIVILITKSVVNLLDELHKSRMQSEKTNARAEQKAKELAHTSKVLVHTNHHLTESIEKLNATQDQLVQNEKMASLGGLVAGIAHEINTPIGIGVTAASHLQDNIILFQSKFDSGKIKKSEMAEFLEASNEASSILLKNLERAAKLIRSFKQVAIDQTSEDLRSFKLKEYLEEVIHSLRPNLKKTHITIELICDKELELNSYPGAYSQILTNFILNSLIHGYEGNPKGLIIIDITLKDDEILLRYCDDGRGIPEEHITKLFDPFFTTRRGQGGSGLGLHLVYNIVTQQLNGSISAQNKPSMGACFELTIPYTEKV